MFSFKSFRRKCLIRLMTVLGFGGMVGFCIASCQSPKANPNRQQDQESQENIAPVQPETQTEVQVDNPSSQNTDTQVVQETIENTDTVQTETENHQVDSNQDKPSVTTSVSDIMPGDDEDVQEIRNENNVVVDKYKVSLYGIKKPVPAYGIRNDIRNDIRIIRKEVRESLEKLNTTIQSKCHPESGELVVSFTIQNTGKIVKVVSTDGSLKGSKSEKCILDQISKHHFKSFEGKDIPVKYPFKFK